MIEAIPAEEPEEPEEPADMTDVANSEVNNKDDETSYDYAWASTDVDVANPDNYQADDKDDVIAIDDSRGNAETADHGTSTADNTWGENKSIETTFYSAESATIELVSEVDVGVDESGYGEWVEDAAGSEDQW